MKNLKLCCLAAVVLSLPHFARATVYTWNTLTPGAYWSASADWLPTGIPVSADTVALNNTNAAGSPGLSVMGGGPGAIEPGNFNNIIDSAFGGTINTLSYSNLATAYQNTYITNGITLFVTNAFSAGSSTADFGTVTGLATIAGPSGSLVVTNNTNAVVTVGLGSTGGGSPVYTLDMSALGNFTATISRLLVGNAYANTTTINRPGGILYLAQTNTITAEYQTTATETSDTVGTGAVDIGDTTSNAGGDDYLYLGIVNTISADTIVCARQKVSHGLIAFNPTLSGNPIATFGGFTSPRVNVWSLSDGIVNTGTTTTSATEDFSLGTVNAMVNTMYIGRGANVATGSGVSTGTLTFAAGTINVNSLFVGQQVATNTAKYGIGTLNVNSNSVLGAAATLIVNSNLLLGQAINAAATSGTLNINGGNVWVSNFVGSINGGISTVTMNQGVLIVSNTMAAAATTFSLTGAILQIPAAATAQAQVGALNFNDNASFINVSSLPPVLGYPQNFQLLTYTSLSGTPNIGTLPGTYKGTLYNDNNGTLWVTVTNGPAVGKTDEWGGSVNNTWDTNTLNWTNAGVAVAYAEGDLVVFDDLAKTSTVNLLTTHAPATWTVTNNSLNYTLSGPGSISGLTGLTKYNSASLTLKETGGDNFSGGVLVTGGSLLLDNANSAISGTFAVNSGATLQIGNADANGNLTSGPILMNGSLIIDSTTNITAASGINGAGTLTQSGTGRFTMAGTNGYTGNTSVAGGTLVLTAPNAISNSATVSVSGGTLDVSAVTGTANLQNLSLANSAITVSPGYLRTPISVTSLTVGGTSNVVNVASFPPMASYPTTINILQSAASFSGFNFTLGTVPNGYAGKVAQSGDGTTVQITVTSGPVGARPVVFWTGLDIANGNTNWSDASNWQSVGQPAAGDSLVFNNTDAQSGSELSTPGGGPSTLQSSQINNIVDHSYSLSSLIYTNTAANYHNTFINSNVTLNITNSGGLSIGTSSPDFTPSGSAFVTIAGSNGTLNVNNTNSTLMAGFQGASGGSQATLDMSALGTFNASVSTFQVGAATANAVYPSIANAYLAQTNNITAVGGSVNESGQEDVRSLLVGENGVTATTGSTLYLGQVNTLNLASIGVGIAKQTATVEFNPALTGMNPTATIRGTDGVSPVSMWSIGDGLGQSGASSAPTGTVDFSAGSVNALVGTMYLGRSPNVSGAHAATGNLTMGAGTLSVGTMIVGDQGFSNTDYGVGNVTLNGPGALLASNLTLGLCIGSTGGTTSAGTLTINGGGVWAGTIVAGTNGATSTINLSAATLYVTNTAGTPSAPITTLSFTGGTLGLTVNGGAPATNVVATTFTASGTTLQIGSFAGAGAGTNYALISYTGTDPFANLTLAALPAGYSGKLIDNTASSLITLSLSAAPAQLPSNPYLTAPQLQSGTNFLISGTNATTSGTYTILTSTNLLLPLSQWTPVVTNTYNNGVFSYTNVITPGTAAQFYKLVVP